MKFPKILISLLLVLVLFVTALTSCQNSEVTTDSTAPQTTDAPVTRFDVDRIEEVLDRIDSSWVNSLDGDLTEFIIESILLGSGDVYSGYMNKEEYADYNESYYGNYVGIGITVQWSAEKREITVYNVIPNSPASEVGFCPGDSIVAVNGERLSFSESENDALDKVGDMIRGEAGTFVDVTVDRDGEEITYHTERRAVVNPTVWPEMLDYNGKKAMYIMLTGFDYTNTKLHKRFIRQGLCDRYDLLKNKHYRGISQAAIYRPYTGFFTEKYKSNNKHSDI